MADLLTHPAHKRSQIGSEAGKVKQGPELTNQRTAALLEPVAESLSDARSQPTTAVAPGVSTEEANHTVEDISPCLQKHGHFTAFVESLRIYHSRGPRAVGGGAGGAFVPGKCSVTAVTTTPSSRVKVTAVVSDGSVFVEVSDGKSGRKTSDIHKTSLSDGNNVTISIEVDDVSANYSVALNLSAVAVTLEVIRVSKTQGYMQTPGNDKWKTFPKCMDAWKRVRPLVGHVTLLSMSRVKLGNDDAIDVYRGARALLWLNWLWHVTGGSSVPTPELVDSSEINVHFHSACRFSRLGFRITFSYHASSRRPSRFGNGLWNCSAPWWPEVQRHFLCNLDTECAGGEDEASCFYTGHCGQGYLTLYNRCYKYVVRKQLGSWQQASASCTKLGGHLVSLNTAREWDAVIEVLKSRKLAAVVCIGVKPANLPLKFMYARAFQWSDASVAFYGHFSSLSGQYCGYQEAELGIDVVSVIFKCNFYRVADFICEFPTNPSTHNAKDVINNKTAESAVTFPRLSNVLQPVDFVECPAGHLTHAFLACDEHSACWSSRPDNGRGEAWGIPSRTSCPAPMTSLPAMFSCGSILQCVPYTVVCDHRRQCADGSDESFCVFLPCSASSQIQCATSAQCIPRDSYCDNIHHCWDYSDEADCYSRTGSVAEFLYPPPPAAINYDPRRGRDSMFRYDPIARNGCPATHFQCPPGGGYCLPVYLRCNEVADCPGGEDEAGCDAFTCPGYYRCRGSRGRACLHVSAVCDGVPQCPERDDELRCHAPPCPHNCTCHALAFACRGAFAAGGFPDLRYLDAKGSGLGVGSLKNNVMLIHLSLASCGMRVLSDRFPFPSLRSLDLSDNNITAISGSHFSAVTKLQALDISGNPLRDLFASAELTETVPLSHLESMDISRTTLEEIDFSRFVAFPNLLTLNISRSEVKTLRRSDYRSLRNLRVVDMRRCYRVTECQRDLVSDLVHLETVFAENYKLCCRKVLSPEFNPKNCHAPPDSVSSCDRLLSSASRRAVLALCGCFALLGNVASLCLRVLVVKSSGSTPTDVFVTHLAVADAVTGGCVSAVLLADRLFLGSYVFEDAAWRSGDACGAIGACFLLSSQASVCVVFLISIDRLFSSRFSSSSSAWRILSVKPSSAHVLCGVVWAFCAVLAAVPFWPTAACREVFGRTGVCFPLLVTADRFTRANSATFTAFVVTFDFLLTSLAAASQAAVYAAFRRSPAANNVVSGLNRCSVPATSSDERRRREVLQARRVFSSCVLSVACWLPACSLAALASRGSPLLPGWLHALVGMTAAPVASGLRPWLYALEVRGERGRRKAMEALVTRIAAQRRGQKQNRSKAA